MKICDKIVRVKVSYNFKLSELADDIEQDSMQELIHSNITDECFNYPDEDPDEDVVIRYSEIEIDYSAIRRLMFD